LQTDYDLLNFGGHFGIVVALVGSMRSEGEQKASEIQVSVFGEAAAQHTIKGCCTTQDHVGSAYRIKKQAVHLL
jgi:hypothetical protein